MSFFDAPPPPPPPPVTGWVPPPWMPPDRELGSPLAMQFRLARSQNAVMTIRHLVAHSNGIEFQLECLVIEPPEDEEDLMGFMGRPYYTKRSSDPSRLPEGLFRFGVRLADGSKATTLQAPWRGASVSAVSGIPEQPVLLPVGSGSSGAPRLLQAGFWLWPLPPAGRITFVCEWPILGISFTEREIDATPIREAAARSSHIWPK